MTTHFVRVGEVDVDNRRRISLGKIGNREHTRYIVEESSDGEIRLIPAATIPAREALVWQRPEVLESLRRGIEEAAAGDLHDMGTFAAYLEDDE